MQERGQYGIATAASKLDCVQIDGLVVLKIIKHSRDEGNPNEMVSGQLLGMDITQNDTTTLEVACIATYVATHLCLTQKHVPLVEPLTLRELHRRDAGEVWDVV